jgi:lipoate-protein ligase A
MALDWALLDLRGRGDIGDTLRFYSWRDLTVSVGYSQDPTRELDPEICRRRGVSVAFRPTGGALLLHYLDFTYSIVIGLSRLDPVAQHEFSTRVTAAICRGLRKIGLDPRPVSGEEGWRRQNRGACFSSRARYDVVVGSRKIAGNARRRKGGSILQHGSVSLRRLPLTAVDLMPGMEPEERQWKAAELTSQSTTVEDEIGRRPKYTELWPLFLDAFREEFDVAFAHRDLQEHETHRASEFEERVRCGVDRLQWGTGREILSMDRNVSGRAGDIS